MQQNNNYKTPGIRLGDQPEGIMEVYLDNKIHCEGYEQYQTIVICYTLYSGICEGKQFHGTRRIAFLPDCQEGSQILQLLKTAFEMKLIFTIGTSVTSGLENQIVWNGILHKTQLDGGISHYGYPDNTYFNRVKQELSSKGVNHLYSSYQKGMIEDSSAKINIMPQPSISPNIQIHQTRNDQQVQQIQKTDDDDTTFKYKDRIYILEGMDPQIKAFILNAQWTQDLDIKNSKIQEVADFKQIPFTEFFLNLWQAQNTEAKLHIDDICIICQFALFEVDAKSVKDIQMKHFQQKFDFVIALECTHMYHLACLEMCLKDQHLQCAVCMKIYGIRVGDQPEGTMEVYSDKNIHCEGYEQHPTIVINYKMFSGTRNRQQFHGTSRTAFLPDCQEGREVLQLLRIAFERKLIFTVGTSVTSGIENQIVWNGIHHKTQYHGGSSHYGYPDVTYFKRVKLELSSKGVTF